MNQPFKEFRSLAIDASAGCGKTEMLGVRLVGMLLADPEQLPSIVTMTFTRAAAAEILERLLELLYGAALDEKRLLQLKRQLAAMDGGASRDELTAEMARLLLQKVVGALNELKISTLDSFMAGIVQVFPMELGLPGEVSMLSEAESRSIQEQLLRRLFNDEVDLDSDDDFIELCKEASFGNEDKVIFASCNELVGRTMKFFGRRDEDSVWRHWSRFEPTSAEALEQAWRTCRDFADWPPRYFGGPLEAALLACRRAGRETKFSRETKTVMRAFFRVWDDFLTGGAKPEGFAQKYLYPPELRQAIEALFGHGRDILLYQAGRRTEGMQKLLQRYTRLYRREVLEKGRMAFEDLPRLLTDDGNEWRYDIDYRLNARLKHYLVDEFQDTSREQWQVLQSIIDDVHDGEHSLFLVGDVKQAIYGWRSGDSRLMNEVIAALQLEQDELRRSFRYGPEICRALNLLFGPESIGRSALPPETAERWRRGWKMHEAANPDRAGEFQAILVCEGAANASPVGNYAAVILAKLREIGCSAGEFSCGILVRSKADGIELKEALVEREPAMKEQVIWEGDESIGSDRLVTALLALLVYLQHPGDRLSREVVAMSQPVRHLLPSGPEALQRLAARLHHNGFQPVLREWLQQLELKSLVWNEPEIERYDYRSNGNVETLLTAAAAFDGSGQPPDSLDFRDFVSRYKISDTALGNKIRIMTIHNSKGLGFDVVFYPMVNGRHDNLRSVPLDGFAAAADGRWLLYQPREEGGTVPEIRRALERRHADESFEDLCVMYVAMTRAKYGMYVLLPPRSGEKAANFHPGLAPEKETKNGKTKKFVRKWSVELKKGSYYPSDYVFESLFFPQYPVEIPLSFQPLGGVRTLLYVSGRPWSRPAAGTELRQLPPPLMVAGEKRLPRLRRTTPSRLEDSGTERLYFALPEPGKGTDFGNRIHRFFEKIEYLEDFVVPADTPPEVLAHFDSCRRNPEVVELLSRQWGEPWRERTFETVVEGRWVSGCFDRVGFQYDEHGALCRAVIVDYKSNDFQLEELPELAAHYHGQMSIYCRVLAKLLNLPAAAIGCRLLFTKWGLVQPVR